MTLPLPRAYAGQTPHPGLQRQKQGWTLGLQGRGGAGWRQQGLCPVAGVEPVPAPRRCVRLTREGRVGDPELGPTSNKQPPGSPSVCLLHLVSWLWGQVGRRGCEGLAPQTSLLGTGPRNPRYRVVPGTTHRGDAEASGTFRMVASATGREHTTDFAPASPVAVGLCSEPRARPPWQGRSWSHRCVQGSRVTAGRRLLIP